MSAGVHSCAVWDVTSVVCNLSVDDLLLRVREGCHDNSSREAVVDSSRRCGVEGEMVYKENGADCMRVLVGTLRYSS